MFNLPENTTELPNDKWLAWDSGGSPFEWYVNRFIKLVGFHPTRIAIGCAVNMEIPDGFPVEETVPKSAVKMR